MMSLALRGLEAVLNRLLRLDPQALTACAKLAGKSVKLEISDWNIDFFIVPYAQGFQLLNTYHQPPDTLIRGKLLSLVKTGAAGVTTRALFDESIAISGDTHTGEALRDILKQLDIDWEEQLSRIVGDTVAPPLARHLKKIWQCGQQGIRAFGENMTEYLQFESQQLPTKQAVERFIDDVAKLRDDVDRIAARVQRLKLTKESGQ
jgi:ubiquinone biosynthesis accessory factor UbiJ